MMHHSLATHVRVRVKTIQELTELEVI